VTVRSEVGQGSRFEIELPMQGGGARVSRADAGVSPESSASNQ
jgi:hypothetical protein